MLGANREEVEGGRLERSRRSSRVLIRSGSTEWIRNGSKIVRNAIRPRP